MFKFSRLKLILIIASVALTATAVLAGAPGGSNYFQLLANPYTGGDNTGDGGTGNPSDLNYYYVGQSFTSNISINSTHTNASNIWIDYDNNYLGASSLTTGSYFPSWSGQAINPVSGSTYRVLSTGFCSASGCFSSGLGSFGSVEFTVKRPNSLSLDTSNPQTILINTDPIGGSDQSNISYGGVDILDSKEDFKLHLWADVKKPYAQNPSPITASTSVAVESNYVFDLRDSKNGEGDDSGVGTGVNTAAVGRLINFNGTSYLGSSSFSCSGVWGNNFCQTTIDPTSPLGISGDLRNWNYNTLYTVDAQNFKDFASPAQNQLGEPNGPNTMDPKQWTFTTEPDTIGPQVTYKNPAAGDINVPVNSNIVFDVTDRKFPIMNISGTGVDNTKFDLCTFSVTASSTGTIYYHGDSPEVSATPVDYGYRFTINPLTDFAQDETVYVSVSGCVDKANNPMDTANYSFNTVDLEPPFVDQLNPDNNSVIPVNGTISLHVKDTGMGVDLDHTVIYINGAYYTDDGRSNDAVTIVGTHITFATSSNFTTGLNSISGTLNDFSINIKPDTDFAPGAVIPIIVYTKDLRTPTPNIMERYVYGLVAQGGSCMAGSTYCGPGTAWDGSKCAVGACTGSDFCGANTTWNGSQCISAGGGGGILRIDHYITNTVEKPVQQIVEVPVYKTVEVQKIVEKTTGQQICKTSTIYSTVEKQVPGPTTYIYPQCPTGPTTATTTASTTPEVVFQEPTATTTSQILPTFLVTLDKINNLQAYATLTSKIKLFKIIRRGPAINFSGQGEPNTNIELIIY